MHSQAILSRVLQIQPSRPFGLPVDNFYEAPPSNRCFEAAILTKKLDMYKKFSPLAGSRKPVGVAAE